MDITGISNPDNLFSATVVGSQQLESMANDALKSGIDRYMRQDYKGAIAEFQRSLGLSQGSEYAVDAANYMARAYMALDDSKGVVESYETAIRLAPLRDDGYVNLGNYYFAQERYDEAAQTYEKAVKINASADNRFALGQAYLQIGRYADAEYQFSEVSRLEPDKPNGSYGLGLSYSKQERYEDAIRSFEKAVNLDSRFYDAYAEMGYAYADLGLMEEAQRQVDFLKLVDPELADSLSTYMYQADPPEFNFAYSTDFNLSMPMRTPLSALDAYLSAANTEKTFTMKFQFDKQMDRESVQNVFNWRIGRSTGSGPGEAYNYGLSIPDTEVSLSPFPDQVIYDAEAMTATVYFTIRQNADADGTIDPAHIEFQFRGKDVYGLSMKDDADQFSGFSGVA